ncbi:MAG: hypothetical protein QXH32_02075 [Candidatus Caldarchaeum sp.]
MRLYRQGRVILRRVSKQEIPKIGERLPELTIPNETGCAHWLFGKYKVISANGNVYLLVWKSSVLEHPDHMPLRVPAGAYVVTRFKSFDREKLVRSGRMIERLTVS